MVLSSRNLLLCTPEHVSARTLRLGGKAVIVGLESGRAQQMPVCRGRFVTFRKLDISVYVVWQDGGCVI
jgi:hypothetical protein